MSDTIESLRAERDEARRKFEASRSGGLDLIKEANAAHAALAAERVANAGLRAAIEKAPHAPDCVMNLRACIAKSCTCWKREYEAPMPTVEELTAALSAAPPNATTTEKQKDLGALRAASVEVGSGPMHHIGASVWPGLSKLIEEAGEVQQVCGKIIALGGSGDQHWDGSNLRERLTEEIADLSAACDFVMGANTLDASLIGERADAKLKKFREWHEKQRAPASVPPAAAPQERAHCLVHDEGLPLQTCTCTAAAAPQEQQGAAAHGLKAEARPIGCTAACRHIDTAPDWDHETRVMEDNGEIHTDDCGFFGCSHDHDPGECCTSGRPGVLCRVRATASAASEPKAPPSSPSIKQERK